MSDQFLGEIRMFGGSFAPAGWNFCDGSVLAISTNDALYALIGTTYGGDGMSTFALPDLRGRIPVHEGTDPNGNPYVLGQNSGTENVTLTSQQMPQHSHPLQGSSNGGSSDPSGNTYGSGQALFSSTAPSITMNAATVGNGGGSQPHENIMPYLCVNFIIALEGIFPSSN